MTLQKLERPQWPAFCNHLSVGLIGKLAEIEIASPAIGAQIEARWAPIIGLTYDARGDIIEIMLEGIEHIVQHPRALYVDYGTSGILSVGILDEMNAWQIVRLREPLMLPAPHT
jgi:hypothetical protein